MSKPKAVCDSSPLITFAKIGRLDLLLKNFQEPLLIPREVYSESVEKGIEKKEPDAVIIGRGVGDKSIAVTKAVRRLQLPFLGTGEGAVISLALEKKITTVCLDESAARNAATQLGLKPIGCLGILVAGVRSEAISKGEALDVLDKMISRDFRISAKILEKFRKIL